MITDWRVALVRVVRSLRRSLWIIAALPLGAALIAGVVSVRQAPQYQAQAEVLVRSAQTPTDQVTQTYANMMVQRPLLQQVVRDLQLTEPPESLSRQVSVTIVPGTTILNVSVNSSSPQLARDIANALVHDLISQVRGIEQQEAATRNTQAGDNLVVLAPATTPQHPISPNIPRDVGLAAGAGFLVALIIAGGREYLDQSIKSDGELVERVGVPPIGHIAYVPAGEGARSELVALQPTAPVAESYRALRTNLVFSSRDGRIKTVLITSPIGYEGKSRTALNLAISLAQAGHRTVLVDADSRRPFLDRLLGLTSSTTLSRLILDSSGRGDSTIMVAGLRDLHFISAGARPANPSAMLGSPRMREVLMDLRDQFDYVLIDTASVNLATDTCALAAIADACILVVESGRTTYHETLYAKRALEQVGAHIAGVVVNKVQRNTFTYYTYHDAVDRRQDVRANAWDGGVAPDSAGSVEARSSWRHRERGPAEIAGVVHHHHNAETGD